MMHASRTISTLIPESTSPTIPNAENENRSNNHAYKQYQFVESSKYIPRDMALTENIFNFIATSDVERGPEKMKIVRCPQLQTKSASIPFPLSESDPHFVELLVVQCPQAKLKLIEA